MARHRRRKDRRVWAGDLRCSKRTIYGRPSLNSKKGAGSVGALCATRFNQLRDHQGIVMGVLVPLLTALVVTSLAVIVQVPELPNQKGFVPVAEKVIVPFTSGASVGR